MARKKCAVKKGAEKVVVKERQGKQRPEAGEIEVDAQMIDEDVTMAPNELARAVEELLVFEAVRVPEKAGAGQGRNLDEIVEMEAGPNGPGHGPHGELQSGVEI